MWLAIRLILRAIWKGFVKRLLEIFEWCRAHPKAVAIMALMIASGAVSSYLTYHFEHKAFLAYKEEVKALERKRDAAIEEDKQKAEQEAHTQIADAQAKQKEAEAKADRLEANYHKDVNGRNAIIADLMKKRDAAAPGSLARCEAERDIANNTFRISPEAVGAINGYVEAFR